MARVNRTRQNRLLRLAGWNRDEDILLVRMLDEFANCSRLQSRHSVIAVLRICAAEISEKLRKNVPVFSLITALASIRRKYTKFKEFLALPGVFYAMRRNRVYARELYWSSLNEKISARSMRTRGEPLYRQLRNIFSRVGCFTLLDESSFGVALEVDNGSLFERKKL